MEILIRFENFWHKEKRVWTIDIMDVYNKEVHKFSQKIFVIAAMLAKKASAIELYFVTVCENFQNRGTEA